MGEGRPDPESVGERLRILALYSLPPAGSPLNLRRERQMLRRRIQQLVGAGRAAIDLHIPQYGVTPDRLRDVIEEGEGCDVIHFSGHGLPGALVLERPDAVAIRFRDRSGAAAAPGRRPATPIDDRHGAAESSGTLSENEICPFTTAGRFISGRSAG